MGLTHANPYFAPTLSTAPAQFTNILKPPASTFSPSDVTINLPPDAILYVTVLGKVPLLKEGQKENYPELKNKLRHWLGRHIDGGITLAEHIIMAWRVGWIG